MPAVVLTVLALMPGNVGERFDQVAFSAPRRHLVEVTSPQPSIP
jgi:hypothetical protein